jgi:uncharacterized membrane protein
MVEETTSSSFSHLMNGVARVFEGVGVGILVVGALWSAWVAIATWRRTSSGGDAYLTLRRAFGSSLLLGLEVLVAADLIRTVAVAPTLENVLVLGLIVLIRTFLSFSLQIEIEGRLPWRRPNLGGTPKAAASAGPAKAATAKAATTETATTETEAAKNSGFTE